MSKINNIVLNTLIQTKKSVEAELIYLQNHERELKDEHNLCIFGVQKCIDDIQLIEDSISLLQESVKVIKKKET